MVTITYKITRSWALLPRQPPDFAQYRVISFNMQCLAISRLKLFTINRSLIIPSRRQSTPTPTITPTRGTADNIFDRNYATGLLTINSSMQEASNQSNDKLRFLSHYYKCTKLTFDWCHDFYCFLYRIIRQYYCQHQTFTSSMNGEYIMKIPNNNDVSWINVQLRYVLRHSERFLLNKLIIKLGLAHTCVHWVTVIHCHCWLCNIPYDVSWRNLCTFTYLFTY